MADLSDQIASTAAAPAHAAGDGQETTGQPLSALIAADQYLKAAAGVRKKRRGLRFTKIIPAGAMADCQGTRNGTSFGGGLQ